MMKIFLIVLAFSPVFMGFSQEENWLHFEMNNNNDTLAANSAAVELDFEAEDGTVNIHKDARIDKLKEFVRLGEESMNGILIDGYRVMIYFDQDKTKSEQQKAHFMALYDEHKTYVDYLAPNYRVRVGNFRSKLEAEKLKQDILAVFPTSIVVSDKIQLPVIEGEDTSTQNQ